MTRIEDVTLLKKLGSGPIMDKPENKRHLEYEINILKGLNHPNVYKIEEIKTTPEYYIILTEYINVGASFFGFSRGYSPILNEANN